MAFSYKHSSLCQVRLSPAAVAAGLVFIMLPSKVTALGNSMFVAYLIENQSAF